MIAPSARYAVPFLVLALVFGAALLWVDAWPARVAMHWTALAMLVVGAAYLAGSPRVFMKNASGRRHMAGRLLLWPFDLLNSLIFSTYRRLSSEPLHDEILPGLHLGRRLWDDEAGPLGDCSVLDLTCEFNENRPMRGSGRYLCLPVLDNAAPSLRQLEQGVQWLMEALRNGRVYVHCAAGHGRSATVVLAYLMAIGMVLDVEEGIAFLKARRPGVRLNAAQRAVLREFVRRRQDRAAGPGQTGVRTPGSAVR